jgi:hypothetical protein
MYGIASVIAAGLFLVWFHGDELWTSGNGIEST